jgi:hypothetical protein
MRSRIAKLSSLVPVLLLMLLAGDAAARARTPHVDVPQAAAPPADTAPAAAKAEHCALSLGVVLGSVLSFWANPIVAYQVFEVGLMMTLVYCST